MWVRRYRPKSEQGSRVRGDLEFDEVSESRNIGVLDLIKNRVLYTGYLYTVNVCT